VNCRLPLLLQTCVVTKLQRAIIDLLPTSDKSDEISIHFSIFGQSTLDVPRAHRDVDFYVYDENASYEL